ncbi:MAG: alpha-amylase/4-alpha-glucanotransferase domain-containing protein, partial [Armatimonadota bacterium]
DETETIHTTRVRVKEWGLERYLTTDWYRRSSLLDHFLPVGTNPAAFTRGEVRELGDFVNQPYQVTIENDAGARSPDAHPVDERPTGLTVRLLREGHVWIGTIHAAVRVEKALTIPPGSASLEAAYRISNLSDRTLAVDFAVETNWSTSGPDAAMEVAGASYRVGDLRRLDGADVLTLRDEGRRLEVGTIVDALDPPFGLWIVPIEVVSASEAGFERTFQGASLLTVWALRLAPGDVWEGRLSYEVRVLLGAPRAGLAALPEQTIDAV